MNFTNHDSYLPSLSSFECCHFVFNGVKLKGVKQRACGPLENDTQPSSSTRLVRDRIIIQGPWIIGEVFLLVFFSVI